MVGVLDLLRKNREVGNDGQASYLVTCQIEKMIQSPYHPGLP